MSADEQKDAAWVYWSARALQGTGARPDADGEARTLAARQLLESIAGQMHFYGKLAAEDLGGTVALPPKPAAAVGRRARGRAAQPGLRARAAADRHRPAQRGRARMELHAARHGRPRAAGRRAAGLRPRGLGPLHQHQRPHARRGRHGAALPDALPAARWWRRRARSASTRPTSTA